jgi:excisionase family DNA binding protein
MVYNGAMEKGTVSIEQGFATASEAAEFLNLSRAGLHQFVKRGIIPGKKFGRALRIPWLWLHDQVEEALRKVEQLPGDGKFH